MVRFAGQTCYVKTLLGATLFTGIVFAKHADAAAPRLIMVYGSPLRKPVILGNWRENLEFMSSITQQSSVTPEELRRRPYLRLALFWGPEWAQYVEEGKPIDKLRPEQANQQGRFYPAVGHASPVVTLDMPPGSVGPSWRQVREGGIRILLRYGIPVRLPPFTRGPDAGRSKRAAAAADAPNVKDGSIRFLALQSRHAPGGRLKVRGTFLLWYNKSRQEVGGYLLRRTGFPALD